MELNLKKANRILIENVIKEFLSLVDESIVGKCGKKLENIGQMTDNILEVTPL